MSKKTFDTRDLAAFLARREGLTRSKSQVMASEIMLKLAYDMPQLVVICKLCTEEKGNCRCKQHSYELEGKWRYKVRASPWMCTISSLINMSDTDLKKALGARSSYQRVTSYIAYLRRQR